MKRKILPFFILLLAFSEVFAQVNITFEVNSETLANVDPTGLFIAGGAGFGVPGDNPMVDPDGDGIYTVTIQREQGFSSFYTILNGNCPDWSCKENIAGQACSDPANFNDRFLPPVMADTTIIACFGVCDNDACMIVTDSVDITFQLNTSLISPDASGVFIAGGGNFGNPGDNPMIDPDGDGIYTITIRKPRGFASHYTFTNGSCPDYSCKEDISGLPCADPNAFNDRFIPSLMADTTILACFGNCASDGTCSTDNTSGTTTDSVNITFQLHTSGITVDPEGVFIGGGGNFGNPGDNPMLDPDGDGIYTFTSRRPSGFSSHYTFLNGYCPDWSCKEDLTGLPCGDPNAFNDRFLSPVMTDITIIACFGTCDTDGNCGSISTPTDFVDITFQLNTALITPDAGGVFVAGGGNFGNPGDNPMSDPDGDGIYTVTIQKPKGFSSYYTFTNGNCPDYSCKENIAGLPCADPNNFNDRFIPSVMADTTILACFGTCDKDGGCAIITDSIDITFHLNTTGITVDPAGVFIGGGGNFGNPGDNPMVDPDGDGIYTFTSRRALGFSSYYTFLNGNCPDWSCKEDLAGLPCGDPNAFNDRFFSSIMSDTTILACFGNCANDGSCTTTVSVNGLTIDEHLFTLRPTIVNDYTTITFNESAIHQKKQLVLMNAVGEVVYTANTQNDLTYQINTSNYAGGIYLLSVRTERSMLSKKFVVQK